MSLEGPIPSGSCGAYHKTRLARPLHRLHAPLSQIRPGAKVMKGVLSVNHRRRTTEGRVPTTPMGLCFIVGGGCCRPNRTRRSSPPMTWLTRNRYKGPYGRSHIVLKRPQVEGWVAHQGLVSMRVHIMSGGMVHHCIIAPSQGDSPYRELKGCPHIYHTEDCGSRASSRTTPCNIHSSNPCN